MHFQIRLKTRSEYSEANRYYSVIFIFYFFNYLVPTEFIMKNFYFYTYLNSRFNKQYIMNFCQNIHYLLCDKLSLITIKYEKKTQ